MGLRNFVRNRIQVSASRATEDGGAGREAAQRHAGMVPPPPGMDKVSQWQQSQRMQGLLAQKDRPVHNDTRPDWERQGFKSENHMNENKEFTAKVQADYAAKEHAKSWPAREKELRESSPSPQGGLVNRAIREAKGY